MTAPGFRVIPQAPPPSLVPGPVPTGHDALTDYVAASARPDGSQAGVYGPVTPSMIPYLRSQGIRDISNLDELPDGLKAHIGQFQPIVDRLGPNFDWANFSHTIEQNRANVPDQLYDIMAPAAILGASYQARKKIGQMAGAGILATTEAAQQATFGLYGKIGELAGAPPIRDLQQQAINELDMTPAQANASKLVGSIFGLGASGHMVVSTFGLVTKLPRIAPLVLQIPQRVRQVMLGIGVGATMDALRPDGLPQDPASIDFTARMARPMAEAMGDSPMTERIALGLAGGVTGGVVGELLGGVVRGAQMGRNVMSNIGDAELANIRQVLNQAGINTSIADSRVQVLSKLFKNLDKLPQSEGMAGPVMQQLAREDYLTNLLQNDPRFAEASALGPEGRLGIRLKANGQVIPGEAGESHADIAQRIGFPAVDETGAPTFERGVMRGKDYLSMTSPQGQEYIGTVREGQRYLAALFRTNPGGVSIATNISATVPIEDLSSQLGIKVVTVRSGNNVLVARPEYQFPTIELGIRQQNRLDAFQEFVRQQNVGKSSTAFTVLPDGTFVRGSYSPAEATEQFKIKVPEVDGVPQHDAGLREGMRLVQGTVLDGAHMVLDVPSQVTRDQVNVLSRLVDRGIAKVTLNPAGLSRTATVLENPISAQLQDALATATGVPKPKITAAMMSRIQQFTREGVFNGQAAVLPDGYPVQVLRRYTTKAGSMVQYLDPMINRRYAIPESNITVLPTSLEGEFAPSNMFMDALAPEERDMFANLRDRINQGLAQPIKSFHDLEGFATSRGLLATSMKGGKVSLWDANSGERLTYENTKAAVQAIRQRTGPLPNLTPIEVEQTLGGDGRINLGGIGSGGPPPRFGERIPLPDYSQAAEAATGVPTGGILTPTRGYFLDLERRYNLPFGKIFLELQTQQVLRQNFLTTWVEGAGPGRASGVMPLESIERLAGKGANQQLITAFNETATTDPARNAQIAAQMTPREIQAAKELRKWYNALGQTFGIGQDGITGWLEDYMPHFRQQGEVAGNDLEEIWRRTRTDKLPKEVEFPADYARDGHMDIYEDRAFIAARQYAGMGSYNRYLNEGFKDAALLLKAIPNARVKAPLDYYLQSLKGTEFAAQRETLNATVSRAFANLGIPEQLSKTLGEKFAMNAVGMAYSAAIPFRMGQAIRNLAQVLQTTWPMLGKMDPSEFAEGLGRAMSQAGRDQAILDGAVVINQQPTAALAGDEAIRGGAAPIRELQAEKVATGEIGDPILQRFSEVGMRLYDGADNFNRVVAYQVQRVRAEKAIAAFAADVRAGANSAEAIDRLTRSAGLSMYDKPIVEEFLRRVGNDPNAAAGFLGKQAADVTQFLYGKGNQPRWMRSVPGRIFGQFGSWPLWFIDYTTRTATNLWRNGDKLGAAAFLGRIALADMALYEAGKAVGLDARRYMGMNSLFYNGGPAIQAFQGAAEMLRGAGDYIGQEDTPGAKQRMSSAANMLAMTGRAFIPYSSALRDIGRLMNADTPEERMAAMLAVYPTQQYTVAQRLNLMVNPNRMSSDTFLETQGDRSKNAGEIIAPAFTAPIAGAPTTQAPGAAKPGEYQPDYAQTGRIRESASAAARMFLKEPTTPGPSRLINPTALPPSIRSGESKPNL